MSRNSNDNLKLIKREVLRLYSRRAFSTGLYAFMRLKLAPIADIERYVPRKGRIFDLGCGNGIFANILALGSPERSVKGVDLDAGRVKTAKEISSSNPNLEFVQGDVNSLKFERYSVVTVIDLLHHMPYDNQAALLKNIYEHVEDGAIVIVKDLEKSPRWKYLFHYVQDSLSYRQRLFFRNAGDMVSLLHRIGFSVEIISLAAGFMHPHILYICRKSGEV